MTFVLGLTGSIGMGKSTTAQMFSDLDIPVWDADRAVHELYDIGGAAVTPVSRLVPAANDQGRIDRAVLKEALAENPDLLDQLEKTVHPLVAQERAKFLEAHQDAPLVVLDIPLLFETGGQDNVDAVAVVSTDPDRQRSRVLERPAMTEAQFDAILARQMPDAEKRARADFVIPTDTLEQARQVVADLVSRLTRATNA